MTTPRILVCGSRAVDHTSQIEYRKVSSFLNKFVFERKWIYEPDPYGNWLPRVVVIQGECPTGGIDSLADQWAVCNWCKSEAYPVLREDIQKWGFGIAANMRNQRMLDEGKPDVVIAFKGGRGTADMVDRATRAGVEVIHAV